MNNIYTIGFTKKTAKEFFELLENHKIALLLDIRLNNTSQLSSFSKYPDIEFLLNRVSKIKYIHDSNFAPTQSFLREYRKGNISWRNYEDFFNQLMDERNIRQYIIENYQKYKDVKICLLCSEPTADRCHRRLVANLFNQVLGLEIINI